MKYKIVTNGYDFKVKFKYKYWPFWYLATSVNAVGELGVALWPTKIKAEDYIKRAKDIRVQECAEYKEL